MLQINDGDGTGQWVRPSAPGEAVTDPYLKGTAGSLQPALWRAKLIAECRPRLPDGARVWAHIGERFAAMERCVIDDDAEPERGAARYVGTRVVRSLQSGRARLLNEARMVLETGYYQRLLAGTASGRVEVPASELAAATVRVWRSEIWWEGLFSMLFWAVGFVQTEAAAVASGASTTTHCLIDWTDERLCYNPPSRASAPANAWLSLFEQPPPLSHGHAPLDAAALETASTEGQLVLSVCYGLPGAFGKLGELRGADPSANDGTTLRGGRLRPEDIHAGRNAFAKWVTVLPPIERRAAKLQSAQLEAVLPMREWLGVHVRRSDKLVQCPENAMAEDAVAAEIRAFAVGLGCGGVFLCSCDAIFKRGVARQLEARGLLVAVLDEATLPASPDRPPHMDASLDARRNAQDCLVEVLVLSRCAALLSTWSHVSVAAVYFAPDGYPHMMFGDLPPTQPQRQLSSHRTKSEHTPDAPRGRQTEATQCPSRATTQVAGDGRGVCGQAVLGIQRTCTPSTRAMRDIEHQARRATAQRGVWRRRCEKG